MHPVARWARGGRALAAATLLALAGCASQPYAAGWAAPGFFFGLLHGVLAPLALFGSLVIDIRIYAFPNSGWGYDCGYLIGLCGWAGGAAKAS